MVEYWLQKKTIGGWSHVTWYADADEAWRNLNSCASGMSGYSWRLVKVETLKEVLLDEVVEVEPPTPEPLKPKSGWIEPRQPSQDAPKSSGWGSSTPSGGWNATSNNPSPSVFNPSAGEHGLSGSVWLVHHGKKHKTRVAADKVAAMMAEGYVKGGPATRFE